MKLKFIRFLIIFLLVSCKKDTPTKISPMAVDSLINHHYVIFLDIKLKESPSHISPLKSIQVNWDPDLKLSENSEIYNQIKIAKKENKKIVVCCAGEKTIALAQQISNTDLEAMYFETVEEWMAKGLPFKETNE